MKNTNNTDFVRRYLRLYNFCDNNYYDNFIYNRKFKLLIPMNIILYIVTCFYHNTE